MNIMASLSPKSPEQSEKSKQYDRQLRLWGDHGQSALENGHVCLIHATALGTEALKSIVLPGIGAVTIVDEHTVNEDDIGSNFFLETTSLGLNRGAEALKYILELNPAVQGHSVPESPDQLLKENPDFFKSFSIVVATALAENTIKSLSQNLWDADIPLILCRSIGFLGSLRIQVKEHTVIETHPDNEQPDLRLDMIFDSLREYLDSFNLEDMEYKEHAHLTWLVVLYKSLEKWRNSNDNRWPSNRKDRLEISELLRQSILKDDNGVPLDEENFEEAIRAVNTALTPTKLPENVKEILYDSAAINLTKDSSPFWVMCSALRGFVEQEGDGNLPVRGTIPDMTATTDHFIKLQSIYRSKAASDAEAVHRRVQQIVIELGVESINESDIKLICRHAGNLHLVRGSCINQEYQAGSPPASYIARHLEDPDMMMVHYILFRAVERFQAEHCRAPGDWEFEGDIAKLKTCVSKLLNDLSCAPFPKDDHVHEMCRYGGAEIHSVSAFMGGCVAHEVIKLITKQYKPVNNTFIHDAASTNSAIFTF